jgi:hypothetical protein
MSLKTPLAFLSYAHSDDEHESGKLRLLAERLSGEVRLQSGSEFPIFIDRTDLRGDRSGEFVLMSLSMQSPFSFRS